MFCPRAIPSRRSLQPAGLRSLIPAVICSKNIKQRAWPDVDETRSFSIDRRMQNRGTCKNTCKIQTLCIGRERGFIEPLTHYGEPPNSSSVRFHLGCGRGVQSCPSGAIQGKFPAPLMVGFLNFHPYLPFEIGKSDVSKPETAAVPPGLWHNNAPASIALAVQRAPPAAECKQ